MQRKRPSNKLTIDKNSYGLTQSYKKRTRIFQLFKIISIMMKQKILYRGFLSKSKNISYLVILGHFPYFGPSKNFFLKKLFHFIQLIKPNNYVENQKNPKSSYPGKSEKVIERSDWSRAFKP